MSEDGAHLLARQDSARGQFPCSQAQESSSDLAGWLSHFHGIQPTSHHEPESVSDLLYDLELVYLMEQDVFSLSV